MAGRPAAVDTMTTTLFPPGLEALIRSRLGQPAAPIVQARSQVTPAVRQGGPSELRQTQSPARGRIISPLAARVLTASEIVRELRRYRYDRARGKRVPIRALADLVGLSHETLYAAIKRAEVSDFVRSRLSWAIIAISEGRLRFRRYGQQWEVEDSEP